MSIATVLEHTALSVSLTSCEVEQVIHDANSHQFATVCIPPFWVKKVKRDVINNTPVCTVIGFPLGYQLTETKMAEAEHVINMGADELDVCMNISAFKTGMPWVKIELAKLSGFVHNRERILKVIIETALLTDQEIVKACKICADAGADFVKTSTGFQGGATPDTVKLMKSSLPSDVGIKASGGIKTLQQCNDLLAAGAARLGTSSALTIIKAYKSS